MRTVRNVVDLSVEADSALAWSRGQLVVAERDGCALPCADPLEQRAAQLSRRCVADHMRCDDRRQERDRYQCASELLERDGNLHEGRARSTVIRVDGDARELELPVKRSHTAGANPPLCSAASRTVALAPWCSMKARNVCCKSRWSSVNSNRMTPQPLGRPSTRSARIFRWISFEPA